MLAASDSHSDGVKWCGQGLLAVAIRLFFAAAVSACLSRLHAQSLTTSTIRGMVRAADLQELDGTVVRIANRATGYTIDARVGAGVFVARGLQVGGPYTVTVRRFGYAPWELSEIFLALGETRELSIVLNHQRLLERLGYLPPAEFERSFSSLRTLASLTRHLCNDLSEKPQGEPTHRTPSDGAVSGEPSLKERC